MFKILSKFDSINYMQFDNLLNKSIVITDYCYFPIFLKIRRENPLIDFKLISKQDLISFLDYEYDREKCLKFLMSKNYTFNESKKLLSHLPFISKEHRFFQIKEELINLKLTKKNNLGSLFFNQYKIFIFELDEDTEIQQILKNNDLSFDFLHLNELVSKLNVPQEVFLFQNYFELYNYIFSDISKKIKEENFEPSSIYIYADDNSTLLYLKQLSNLYGIKINPFESTSLISDTDIKKKLDLFYKEKKISIIEDANALVNQLNKIIENYELDKYENFDLAFLNLKEILSTFSISTEKTKGAINLINKPIFLENAYIYVTNFQYGNFYKVETDNDIISDDELAENNLLTSYNKTKLNYRRTKNFLMFNNFFALSRVKFHLSEKIHNSQFVEEFKMKITNKNLNENGLYTSKITKLLQAKYYDEERILKAPEYKTYNNEFKKFDFDKLKLRYSASSLNSFAECPFKFYLERVLKLQEGSKSSADFGTFVHDILEHKNEAFLNFDKVFSETIEKYTTKKDESYYRLLCTRPFVEEFIKYLKNFEDTLNITNDECEKNISDTIYLYDKSYSFQGKIDKVFTINIDGKLYTNIVDYKTGATTLDPTILKLGFNLQLPLYSYLLEKSGEYNIGGIFIQHPPLKVKENSEKINIVDLGASTLNGLYLSSSDYIKGLDKTRFKKDGGLSSKKGTYLSAKTIIENFNTIFEDMKLGLYRNISEIENGDFNIRPFKKTQKDESNCRYCTFRDICYRKAKYRILVEELKGSYSDNGEDDEF